MSRWDVLTGPRLRYGAKVALAAVAAWLLTAGGRNEYALFSAMGAALVVGGSLGEDLSSSLNRVRGTLAGTAVGVACAFALGSNVWSLGVTVASMAWLSVGLGWGPAAMRPGIAMAIVVLLTHTADAAHYALWRALNTLIGVAIGLLVARIVWPVRGRERVAACIGKVQAATAVLLERLSQAPTADTLLQGQVELLDTLTALRVARRDARLEQRLHVDSEALTTETRLTARVAVAALGASLHGADLAAAPADEGGLQEARRCLAALAARVAGKVADQGAARDFEACHAQALLAAQGAGPRADTRATLAALLADLRQISGALDALQDARRPDA